MDRDLFLWLIDNFMSLIWSIILSLFFLSFVITAIRVLTYKDKPKNYNKARLLKEIERSILELDGRSFEEFMAYLFAKNGYKVWLTGATRDGGKDLILNDDTYVELKCYAEDNLIGVDIIKKLYASCVADDINKAIIITTSRYSKTTLELIDTYNKQGFELDHWYMCDILELCNKIDLFNCLVWLGYDVNHVKQLNYA